MKQVLTHSNLDLSWQHHHLHKLSENIWKEDLHMNYITVELANAFLRYQWKPNVNGLKTTVDVVAIERNHPNTERSD
jgi:hypothetical protein